MSPVCACLTANRVRLFRISARMLLCSGERCITMAIEAGKFAGKPPKMTDKAFKPPTEAAMAMTGKARLVGVIGNSGRATGAGFFALRADVDFFLIWRGNFI